MGITNIKDGQRTNNPTRKYEENQENGTVGIQAVMSFKRSLYSFAWAAITKYHRLGGFNNRNLFFHSTGN